MKLLLEIIRVANLGDDPAFFFRYLEVLGVFAKGLCNALLYPVPRPPCQRLLPGKVEVKTAVYTQDDRSSKVLFPGLTPYILFKPYSVLKKSPFHHRHGYYRTFWR